MTISHIIRVLVHGFWFRIICILVTERKTQKNDDFLHVLCSVAHDFDSESVWFQSSRILVTGGKIENNNDLSHKLCA